MARHQRRRTVRADEGQQSSRPVRVDASRRFFTAQGNDSANRTATALQRAFGAGTELYSDVVDRRNDAGMRQAGADFATGNKDLDQKTKGYLDSWDKLEAERDINDIKKELPEILRGANWEELSEDDVQGVIDDYMTSKFEGIDPQSAYAEVWTPGSLAINNELLNVHKDMTLQNIRAGQKQDIFSNLTARFEASREVDPVTGEPKAGSETFDYDYLADQTRVFFDGAEKRTQFKELLFHFAIENGRPDLIENAPDRFANEDPTGVTEDIDEYREALNAARRAQAVKLKAQQDAAAQADSNRVAELQFSVYAKRANGDDFSGELRELYGMAVDGRAEFGDWTSAKNFGDSQFDEREEHAPDYPLTSTLWNEIYNGNAGVGDIFQAREEGLLGFGKTADDLMQKMMSTVERMTPNRDALSAPEVAQYRSQLGQHYNPSTKGPLQAMDQTRFHAKNLALDDYNSRIINGEDPTDAYNAVRQKYDSVLENVAPIPAIKTSSSPEFVKANIITPAAIKDVINGEQSWSVLTSGIPPHVAEAVLIEGVDDGTITKEDLEKIGITID
jgi:hypothetical protein